MPRRVTLNVSLPPSLKAWVDEQVETRGFGTASEYFRHLVRRDREARSPLLRDPLDLGDKIRAAIASGPATPLTKSDFNAVRAEVRRRTALKRPRRKSA